MGLVSRLLISLQHGAAPERASDCPSCFLPKACGAKHFLPACASVGGLQREEEPSLEGVPEDIEICLKAVGRMNSHGRMSGS